MTIDRTALRRLSEGITPLGCPPRMDVACRLASAVPALLDELDAKDRRIAELESDLLAATEQADSWRTQAQQLAGRVKEMEAQIDAKDRRIDWLEIHPCNEQRARLVDEVASLNETIRALELQLSIATELNVGDRKRIAELEAGLREAIGWIPHPHFATIERLRKLLPSEET